MGAAVRPETTCYDTVVIVPQKVKKENMANCKTICRNARFCYEKGFEGLTPENCARYEKIEDLLIDARYDAAEDRAKEEPEDPDDWEE